MGAILRPLESTPKSLLSTTWRPQRPRNSTFDSFIPVTSWLKRPFHLDHSAECGIWVAGQMVKNGYLSSTGTPRWWLSTRLVHRDTRQRGPRLPRLRIVSKSDAATAITPEDIKMCSKLDGIFDPKSGVSAWSSLSSTQLHSTRTWLQTITKLLHWASHGPHNFKLLGSIGGEEVIDRSTEDEAEDPLLETKEKKDDEMGGEKQQMEEGNEKDEAKGEGLSKAAKEFDESEAKKEAESEKKCRTKGRGIQWWRPWRGRWWWCRRGRRRPSWAWWWRRNFWRWRRCGRPDSEHTKWCKYPSVGCTVIAKKESESINADHCVLGLMDVLLGAIIWKGFRVYILNFHLPEWRIGIDRFRATGKILETENFCPFESDARSVVTIGEFDGMPGLSLRCLPPKLRQCELGDEKIQGPPWTRDPDSDAWRQKRRHVHCRMSWKHVPGGDRSLHGWMRPETKYSVCSRIIAVSRPSLRRRLTLAWTAAGASWDDWSMVLSIRMMALNLPEKKTKINVSCARTSGTIWRIDASSTSIQLFDLFCLARFPHRRLYSFLVAMVRQELLLPDYLLDNWAESLYELGRTTDSGKVRPDMVSLLNIPKPAILDSRQGRVHHHARGSPQRNCVRSCFSSRWASLPKLDRSEVCIWEPGIGTNFLLIFDAWAIISFIGWTCLCTGSSSSIFLSPVVPRILLKIVVIVLQWYVNSHVSPLQYFGSAATCGWRSIGDRYQRTQTDQCLSALSFARVNVKLGEFSAWSFQNPAGFWGEVSMGWLVRVFKWWTIT